MLNSDSSASVRDPLTDHRPRARSGIRQSPFKFRDQSFSDGAAEILGMENVVHMGECQVGFSKGVRIAQGRLIEMEVDTIPGGPFPIHIDGEPLDLETPSTISFQCVGHVQMLANDVSDAYIMESKIYRVLDWAVEHQHILPHQRELLFSQIKKRVF
eukprot:TRINITY_DN9232_c0_g1_i1.p1 TRINITY_DN9232_c0_g1~~TRINITY_DN9232_c0_g1_i1.p1  ORF type:complete len:157 (+),score=34.39 TRINITY_DN9232_c0_g1_i1:136-606(+)